MIFSQKRELSLCVFTFCDSPFFGLRFFSLPLFCCRCVGDGRICCRCRFCSNRLTVIDHEVQNLCPHDALPEHIELVVILELLDGRTLILGELCDTFRASDDKSVLFFWLYAVAYSLHIYFDFSGYSDMAIGLGKIFGFDFLENFNYPYISASITEFWRRWHMSLGSWFRDYVYIPLGGNRVSRLRHLFNIFVVWMLTGFWHGAAWNFIVWGLFFAVLLMVEKLWLLKYLKKSRVLSHIYVVVLIIISFVILGRSSGISQYTLSPENAVIGWPSWDLITTILDLPK